MRISRHHCLRLLNPCPSGTPSNSASVSACAPSRSNRSRGRSPSGHATMPFDFVRACDSTRVSFQNRRARKNATGGNILYHCASPLSRSDEAAGSGLAVAGGAARVRSELRRDRCMAVLRRKASPPELPRVSSNSRRFWVFDIPPAPFDHGCRWNWGYREGDEHRTGIGRS